MQEEPPPLPQISRKRILPAFLLCFVFCAHRIYAGRYLSGLVQIGWAVGGFVWIETTCKDLITMVHSSPMGMELIERVADWEDTHGVPYLPVLALIGVGIWIAADAARLVAGKFTDAEGRKISRWM